MLNESPRRRMPRWASTLIVVVLAVLVLTPGPWQRLEVVGSAVMAPAQMGLAGAVDDVAGVLDTLGRVRDLADQNRAYQDQIDQLQSQLARMRELEVENRDLRNLLAMKERTGPVALLPITVIAHDDTPYVQAITIDRGTSGGVREGSVVVTHRGLVGRVERANLTSAKVRLITDINMSVAVRLQSESRTTGVLRGQSRGNMLVIAYIPQTDVVSVGDVVITSGLGEVFPEGLVVGKVARVERKDTDPFQAAVVEPAVEMDKLERLYVLADVGKQ